MPALFWTTDQRLRITSSLGAALVDLGLGPNQLVGRRCSSCSTWRRDAPGPSPSPRTGEPSWGRPATFEVVWESGEFHGKVAPLYDSEWRVIGTVCVAVEAADRPISLTGSGEALRAGHVA
jgi:hypothetical protein